MKARKPIRKRRLGPPRHGRIIDEPFLDFVATKGCLLAGRHMCDPWLTIHHVKEGPGAQKNDRRAVRLCAAAHLHAFGPDAIEHGRVEWEAKWGIDLEAVIREQNAEYGGCGNG